MLLPRNAAQRLYPKFPEGTHSEIVSTAGGPDLVHTSLDLLEGRVVTRDRKGPVTDLRTIISDVETEILVSDTAIDALGLEVKSHGRGLWRFAGEARVRASARRRDW